MNKNIAKYLTNIETASKAMLDIPASEQSIGHIQVAIFAALTEITRCLAALAAERKEEKPIARVIRGMHGLAEQFKAERRKEEKP